MLALLIGAAVALYLAFVWVLCRAAAPTPMERTADGLAALPTTEES